MLLYSRKSLSRAVYAIRYGLPHHGVSGYNPLHQKRHLDRWRRMDREGAPQRIWKRHQWRHRDQSKDKKIPRVRRVLQRVRGWNCWKIIFLFLAVTSPKLSSQSIKSYSNCNHHNAWLIFFNIWCTIPSTRCSEFVILHVVTATVAIIAQLNKATQPLISC